MTATTDQFADIAKRSQDLVTESVRGWTETVQGLGRRVTDGAGPQLPDAGATVDRVFDFYEQLLGHQRELARTVVGAGTAVVDQLADHASRAAESVTEHATPQATRHATEQVQDEKPARASRAK